MDIFIIVILLLLSALLTASETSLISVNKSRLRELSEEGNRQAKMTIKLCDNFDKTITAILLSDTVINILTAVIAADYSYNRFGEGYVTFGIVLATAAVIIIGEAIPRGIAGELSLKFALFMSYPIWLLSFLLTPLTWLLLLPKKLTVKLLAGREDEPSVTERDLIDIIDEIEDEGVMDESETDLVKSAVEFSDISVSDILIPRVNIYAVDKSSTVEEIKDAFLKTSFSRIPVYDDTIDNIVGVIHEKQFYKMYLSGKRDISRIMQKPLYIFELSSISDIMEEMQKSKSHMAVVVDQYGGTQGIVTMEDIIEELVGEIYDETDEEDRSCIKISDNEYDVMADVSIRDFLELIDLPDYTVDTDCTSLGGLFIESFGDIPEVNDVIEVGIFKMTVRSAHEQRVDRINIIVAPLENDSDNDEDKD